MDDGLQARQVPGLAGSWFAAQGEVRPRDGSGDGELAQPGKAKPIWRGRDRTGEAIGDPASRR
jgi:hypothetical protein